MQTKDLRTSHVLNARLGKRASFPFVGQDLGTCEKGARTLRHTQKEEGDNQRSKRASPLSTTFVPMASTALHDKSEQKETEPSTDVNGPLLNETKDEEIPKEQDETSTSQENAKDLDKEEEIADDQEEGDKHVVIQPTRRIRTRSWKRQTLTRSGPGTTTEVSAATQMNLLKCQGYNTRISCRCIRVRFLVSPGGQAEPNPLRCRPNRPYRRRSIRDSDPTSVHRTQSLDL